MDLRRQNVLLFTRTMQLGGTENVVLQLCEILKPQVNKVIVCSCGGINVDSLTSMGIKHYQIADITEKSPLTVLSIISCIKKIIRDENITLVHTHHRMATLYMKLLRRFSNVKVISTLHGVFTDKHLATKFAYSDIDIIACGDIVKKQFVDTFGINSNKVTVIHNSVKKNDLGIIPVKEIVVFKSNRTLIAYVGRLSPEKGVDVLLRTLAEVTKENKRVKLFIVGDGTSEYKEYLLNLIDVLYIRDFVVFLGYRSDALNIIKQVDFIVLPSKTEGLPLTPIEAFSQEKTVVATKAGGTVEIIQDGVNGLLCEIDDVQGIAKCILKLCNDVEFRNSLSRAAYDTFEKKFAFAKFKDDIVKYYEKL